MSWLDTVILKHDRARAKRDEQRRLARSKAALIWPVIPKKWLGVTTKGNK